MDELIDIFDEWESIMGVVLKGWRIRLIQIYLARVCFRLGLRLVKHGQWLLIKALGNARARPFTLEALSTAIQKSLEWRGSFG